MKNLGRATAWVLAVFLVAGCSDEPEVKPPKMDFFVVRNESPAEMEIWAQSRMEAPFKIKYNNEERVEFLATSSKIVQVEATSLDPHWKGCTLQIQVGQTMVIFQNQEHIECRAE